MPTTDGVVVHRPLPRYHPPTPSTVATTSRTASPIIAPRRLPLPRAAVGIWPGPPTTGWSGRVGPRGGAPAGALARVEVAWLPALVLAASALIPSAPAAPGSGTTRVSVRSTSVGA